MATVEEALAPATSFTRTNGKPTAWASQVTAAPDGNAVQISHEVRDKLAELQRAASAPS